MLRIRTVRRKVSTYEKGATYMKKRAKICVLCLTCICLALSMSLNCFAAEKVDLMSLETNDVTLLQIQNELLKYLYNNNPEVKYGTESFYEYALHN